MSRRRRSDPPRPRGWIARYGAIVASPRVGAATSKVLLERDLDVRSKRLLESVRTSIRERRRPSRPRMPEALELVRSGRLRSREVVATVAPLDDGPRVLRETFSAGAGKVVLTA